MLGFRLGLLGLLAAAASLGSPCQIAAAADAAQALEITPATIRDGGSEAFSDVGIVRGDDGATRRFYLTPLIGTSWANLGQPEAPPEFSTITNANLFSAGAAAGVAFTRPLGQLRLETEGRYRDDFSITEAFPGAFASLRIDDNWSVLVNAWRDFALTDTFGLYAGGGIGAGGYRLDYLADFGPAQITGDGDIAEFAWQAGGGLIWAVSDRITLDLGYRFYSVGAGTSTLRGTFPTMTAVQTQAVQTQFTASELLFGVRIYEPFRRWR